MDNSTCEICNGKRPLTTRMVCDNCYDLQQENERLRALVRILDERLEKCYSETEYDKLQSQLARYREALEEIASSMPFDPTFADNTVTSSIASWFHHIRSVNTKAREALKEV